MDPTVERLDSLVEYQPGGIVSRKIVQGEAGGLTAFAFDAGQELSEHTSPFEAVVQVTEGEGEFRIEGSPHRVRAGEILRLPANRPHAVRAAARFKMLLTMIRA
jgi:quercetin dioxygenase-like cupin family protein